MQAAAVNYPWAAELEKTVIHSLATSFGLDFLLFKDKEGGDVNTINNVRQGIWATDQEKKKYDGRGDYTDEKSNYHSHINYKTTGQRDKALQEQGALHDPYRNRSMGLNEKRNLDHVISANEIHDDAGRSLAELDGIELANQSSNLQTTQETINKSKKQTPIEDYLGKLPRLIKENEDQLTKNQQRLAGMPCNTPEQKNQVRELEDKIRKSQEKIKNLKSIDHDEMRKRDQEARIPYNQKINQSYYASSKFLKQIAAASGINGLKMGARQMLGLMMAEVWFELRIQIPIIIKNIKQGFSIEKFVGSIKDTLQGIWRRVQARFHDFLIGFKDGAFAGVMASVTTTIFNIFATTQRAAIKIIREVWGHLIKAIKLLAFNPDKLSFVELCKAVIAVISLGASTVIGSMIHAKLLPLLSFPFGSELASFAGALITGIVTLGLNYFLLYSNLAQKIWEFVESIMPHVDAVKKFQAVNSELDQYLIELGRIEFNLDPHELLNFSQSLNSCNSEAQRGLILKKEINKRGIDLPYEIGNTESTKKWLASLIK